MMFTTVVEGAKTGQSLELENQPVGCRVDRITYPPASVSRDSAGSPIGLFLSLMRSMRYALRGCHGNRGPGPCLR